MAKVNHKQKLEDAKAAGEEVTVTLRDAIKEALEASEDVTDILTPEEIDRVSTQGAQMITMLPIMQPPPARKPIPQSVLQAEEVK